MFNTLFETKAKSEKEILVQQFNELMFEFGLFNKRNNTFLLEITEETDKIFKGKLFLVPGLSFHMLDKHIQEIEMYTCCKWNFEARDFRNYAEVEIIKKYFGE